MDGNTNGAGATMHTFISYFPFVWSCVRGSSSYFLTLFDPVIFVPCPWPYYCLTESHRVGFPALSFPESPRRNPDFDDNPLASAAIFDLSTRQHGDVGPCLLASAAMFDLFTRQHGDV